MHLELTRSLRSQSAASFIRSIRFKRVVPPPLRCVRVNDQEIEQAMRKNHQPQRPEKVYLMENIIAVGEELHKYFFESGLNFLPSVPQRRIQEMILAMAQKGYSGKMADCGELRTGHRTTYRHFLSKGKWDHEKVETIQRHKSFQTILSVAEKANQPVYLSIDDTVVPKKKPSRRAAHPMEGTGWHYSHLEGKKVYGYQIHAAIASTGSSTLCYSLRRCCPEHGTKVDMLGHQSSVRNCSRTLCWHK